MKTCIALFRGINVGGRNKLPMKDLVALLDELGAQDIRTYIQSGNAVFRVGQDQPADYAARIQAEVGKRHGFEPYVLIAEPGTLASAIAGNPFPEAVATPDKLFLGFLGSKPTSANRDKLAQLKLENERFHVTDEVFYMHLPDGAGRSKLAAGAERVLGVPMTVRNWTTVCKLAEMANEAAP